jgi:hypothetical protein
MYMKFHPRKGCFSWNKTPMTLEELLVEYDATMEDVYKFLSISADEFDESYKEFFLDVMTGPGTLANEDLTSERERKQRDKERKHTVSSQKISDRHTDISSGFREVDFLENFSKYYNSDNKVYLSIKGSPPVLSFEESIKLLEYEEYINEYNTDIKKKQSLINLASFIYNENNPKIDIFNICLKNKEQLNYVESLKYLKLDELNNYALSNNTKDIIITIASNLQNITKNIIYRK